jgi:peptidoglycan/xylan/chitin deacetylase (PgdA/CDA1 family)
MQPVIVPILKQLARHSGLKRQQIAKIRMATERHALAAIPGRRRRDCGRILCYHSIGEPYWGVNDVSPRRFRRQIENALHAGFEFVPAAKLARGEGKANELAITFDDGLGSVFTQAAPILKDYRIPFSFFVVSGWCETYARWKPGAMMSWRQVSELVENGAEVGSHSATHPNFGTLEPGRYAEELEGSRRTIERRIGVAPVSFAIPLGQRANWTPAAALAATAAGYETVYAQAEDTRPQGTVPRTFVTAYDHGFIFRALLRGAFDNWEEWV